MRAAGVVLTAATVVHDLVHGCERRGEIPRRAGVSSLGMGGTNTHVVLEEAPPPAVGSPSRPWQLLMLSARTASALERMTARLAEWLEHCLHNGHSSQTVAATAAGS